MRGELTVATLPRPHLLSRSQLLHSSRVAPSGRPRLAGGTELYMAETSPEEVAPPTGTAWCCQLQLPAPVASTELLRAAGPPRLPEELWVKILQRVQAYRRHTCACKSGGKSGEASFWACSQRGYRGY